MPSHAYFHARPEAYDWKDEDPREHTPAGFAERERIAEALLAAFPAMTRNGSSTAEDGSPYPWIWLYMPHLEITVNLTYVHVRLGWHTIDECEQMGLVPVLHRLRAVLTEAAGFDMFEHGCQGLDVEGDIDLVPIVLDRMARRMKAVFGGVRAPVEPIEVG